MMRGIGASEGYGIGKALLIKKIDLTYEKRTNCDSETEKTRYAGALEAFCRKTELEAQRVADSVGEKEAEILSGHIMMIKDPYMSGEINKHMEEGWCAESAMEAVCDQFITIFSSTGDEMTKQRAADVQDIKTGMLAQLLGVEEIDISSAPAGTILVAEELTPSMTAGIRKENIAGIVTENGGTTSHSAILARAMEIPAVLSVKDLLSEVTDGDELIVDGCEGVVLRQVTDEQRSQYQAMRDRYMQEKKELSFWIGKPTCDADGTRYELFGNIGNAQDAAHVMEQDGEGVGLFRTEFLFMDRTCAPTEQEQFEAYKLAALTMQGRPLIIRTLDVGGDKDVPYLGMKKEENPFLGFRAIRYCLKNPELYRVQLRALVRASAFGEVRIMLPLVTGVEELRAVKKEIAAIMEQLDAENISYNKNLQVGVMIETPAASLIADILAKEADFFSIGTNDLTQYTMAVDRGNADVAELYSTYHPAVLRSLSHIIACGRDAGIPVGMCGEAASDKRMIPLLIAFGLTEFSVTPAGILGVRNVISKWGKADAEKLTEQAMALETAEEIRELLTNSIK